MSKKHATASLDRLLARADWARGLARRLVQDECAVDDVVQATYLAALENPPRDDASRDAWLRRVVRNVALVMRRGDTRRRQREVRRLSGDSTAPATVDQVAEMEAHRHLVDAVLRLDDISRDVIIQRYFDGRSAESIAAAAGIPSATVRNRLKRALDRLRTDLNRDADEPGTWLDGLVLIAAGGSHGLAGVGSHEPAQSAPLRESGSFPAQRSTSGRAGLAPARQTPTAVRILLPASLTALVLITLFLRRETAPLPDALLEPRSPADVATATVQEEQGLAAPLNEVIETQNAASPPAQTAQSNPAPTLIVRTQYADGRPAPGSRVHLEQITRPKSRPLREVRRPGAYTAIAAADGIAEFPRVQKGQFLVSAGTLTDFGAEEGDPSIHSVTDVVLTIKDSEQPYDVTLVVDRLATVHGRVLDDRGNPLPGCDVSFRSGGFEPLIDGEFRNASGGIPTDSEGRFRFTLPLVEGENHGVVIRHRNYDEDLRVAILPVPGATLDVGTLSFSQAVRGTVFGKVECAAGFSTRVEVYDPLETNGPSLGNWGHWTEAMEIREFEVHGLEPGDYALRVVDRSNVDPLRFRIQSAGDRTDVGMISLEPEERPYLIHGTVVDEHGEPVGSATVTADRMQVSADTDGYFELGARTPGPHRVVASDGALVNTLTQTLDEVLFDGLHHVFELRPRGIVFEFVDAATGAPVPVMRVGIHSLRADVRTSRLSFRQWNLARLEEPPIVHSLRTGDIVANMGTGHLCFVIYVDGYETVEITSHVPENTKERVHRVVVPLHRL